jgi:tRNA threonylcarbamoyladenosine biosynthesis protein TsaB
MIILAIRTDKHVAEIYLFKNQKKLADIKWLADRHLAETIHRQIEKMLNLSSISLKDIDAVVCFKGPGSFTGLRIGHTVANALAYALNLPIVSRGGRDWLKKALEDVLAGENEIIGMPEYGAPAKTTPPKK